MGQGEGSGEVILGRGVILSNLGETVAIYMWF
jgi:hypothetical protein